MNETYETEGPGFNSQSKLLKIYEIELCILNNNNNKNNNNSHHL